MPNSAQSQLDILMVAKNQASSEVKDLISDLTGLQNASGLVTKALAGLGVSLSIAGVKQLVDMGMELSRTAAYAQDVATAFGSLANTAGASGDEMLASLKKGSGGAIADSELMLTANRAMLLGVGSSAEELGKLMDVARVRSNAMGLTTQQAFDNIVTGIGRNSPMILDNLGIVIDSAAAYESYAKSIGKSSNALTENEQKQAMINAIIAQSAGLVADVASQGGDAASKFEAMDASIQNAKVALGELFQPAMIVVAQAIAAAAASAASEMKQLAKPIEEVSTETLVLDQASMGLANDIGHLENAMRQLRDAGMEGSDQYRELAAQLAASKGELGEVGILTAQAAIAANDAGVQVDELTNSFSTHATAAQVAAQMTEELRKKTEALGLTASIARDEFNMLLAAANQGSSLINSAANSAGSLFAGKIGPEAGIAKQKEVSDQLKAQEQTWQDMGYTQEEINGILLPGMISSISQANSKLFETHTGTAKISEEAKKAKQAFDDLKSSVTNVLQGALDTGTGVDVDKVLEKMGIPRADAINENARRLADIAKNGLKDQDWLGNFRNEVPDIWKMIRLAQNPQEEAAYLLRDFQDGLLTSAIDKDKAKEIVRRAILGDQKMSELATEIATELAQEMGIPLEEALAETKSSLGVSTGMEDAGSSSADSFSTGASNSITDNATGTAMIDTMITQVKATYEKLSTAGREAGKVWGDGFLAAVGANVPPSLISILVDLVTPGVMSKYTQQGTLSKPAS